MNNGNMIYVVTDRLLLSKGHTTIASTEQFINWIEMNILYFTKMDQQIMDAANRLIEILNRQIAGEGMHQHIIPAANELDLRVTIIAGTILADWNE